MSKLKGYLAINSLFSAISGLIMIVFFNQLNELFHLQWVYIFPAIGFNLLIFAAFVGYVSHKHSRNYYFVRTITILDALWVVGSFSIVFGKWFDLSDMGYTVISMVAIWIGFLAYQQWVNNKPGEGASGN
jgi:hypothetical protein